MLSMLRGDFKPAQSSKSDFIFQLSSIFSEDETENGDDEDYDPEDDNEKPEQKEDGEFTVRMFGVTEKSESISVKITGFNPYFLVRVPYELQSSFKNNQLHMLITNLKMNVRAMFRDSLVHSEIILRKEFYGFTNERKIKFIRLRFKSISSLRAYSYIFKKPIKIYGISTKELFYQLYESNIDPVLRLCHIRNIKPVGWVKLPENNFRIVKKAIRETRCQYEFVIEWNKIEPAINPNIGPMIIASFDIECVSMDGSFPKAERKEDAIIQIGTTSHYHGQNTCFLKHIITLGKSDPIDGVVVESYDTEEEVLCAWARLIQRLDPDIITGYNIWGFDLKYMYDRAELLGIRENFCKLGRIISKKSNLVEKTLQSSALGQNLFYIVEMIGRVQIDIMKVVQKDHKLDMYKLDFVAETFLKMNKVDLSPKELFAKYKIGGSKNIREIAVYCVQDCELCNRLMNKLDVITNNVGMGNVCHIPLDWLFLRGQGVKIYSLVARQCRLEGFVLKLQNKGADEDKGYEGAVVLVATPGIYMVPISVNDFASLYPSSMISENISHDSIVFYKILDNSGNIVNIQSGCAGWFSLPEFRDYEKKGILDAELKKMGYKTNYIESDNYDGYYGDLTKKASEQDYEYDVTESGKKIIGKTICCYIEKITENGKEEKSVIPRILDGLLCERRITRATAFYEEFHLNDGTVIDGNLSGPKEDDEYYYVGEYKKPPKKILKCNVIERKDKYNSFQQSVLDGLQLAYKITANSLYGQVGAPTSPIYFKELASSTTATGRKLLRIARDITETNFPGAKCVYGDSVTGDTPLILRDSNGTIIIKTIESLSDEWISYDGFRAGESNRKEKQQATCDFEIWVNNHWAKINRIIRHKTKKRIYRVSTLNSCIDVSEDHSLLDDSGEIIKPGDCIVNKTRLLQGFPLCIQTLTSINYSNNGKYIASSKLDAQCIYYYLKCIGYNYLSVTDLGIDSKICIQILDKYIEDPSIIQKIVDLGYISDESYVFDIETTSGRFNGGIGEITLKNTDSVFLTFDQYWEKHLGLKLEGTAALEKSIELCKLAGKMVTASLKKPHDLEYEKTFFPFIQLAKKRYVGNLYENDPHHFKQKSMGIVLKRRDNAMICKDIYGGIVDIILNKRDITAAEEFFKKSVIDLLEGGIDLSKLVITKTLRAEYKMPESIAHKMLADRMTERDPGNKPQSNDRIPFVFIQTKQPKRGEKILQGDKVEHPDFIRANPKTCIPDYMYYLEHQIKVPCIQLFALALEKLTGYKNGWIDETIIRKMKDNNKTELEIRDKIATLREKETERLLLENITRKYLNTQSGYGKVLTDFFQLRKNTDISYIQPLEPKKKTPIDIQKIKGLIENKEIEPPPIISKTDSVKVALIVKKTRNAEKEEKKLAVKQNKEENSKLSVEEKKIVSKNKRVEKIKLATSGTILDL